jgi:hypothetical protein
MQSGTVNISGAKANGIKVELDGKTPTEIYPEHENGDDDEDTGNCYLDDGKLTISNCDGNDIWTDGQLIVNGGAHSYDNCQLAHRVCNSVKRQLGEGFHIQWEERFAADPARWGRRLVQLDTLLAAEAHKGAGVGR